MVKDAPGTSKEAGFLASSIFFLAASSVRPAAARMASAVRLLIWITAGLSQGRGTAAPGMDIRW